MALRIGVIGAGISGLTLALKLREAGHLVVVVDKGRGVGGRSATRRTDGPSFDHGAQYLTARDPSFLAFLDRYVPADRLAVWLGPFAKWEGGELVAETPRTPRLVGVPGMSAIGQAMAVSLDVVTGSTVVGLAGSPGNWSLIEADGRSHGPFDWVVSTAPPVQSAALLGGHSTIAEEAGRVVMQACFTMMVAPETDVVLSFAGIRFEHPVLGWVADNRSKPGRGLLSAIVVQSNHDWAEEHRDDDRHRIAEDAPAGGPRGDRRRDPAGMASRHPSMALREAGRGDGAGLSDRRRSPTGELRRLVRGREGRGGVS